MKLQLGVNITPMAGYTNISPNGDGEKVLVGDFKDLNLFVENSEAVEILAPNIMDYVKSSDVYEVVKHLVSKLRKGGKIVLGGSDPEEISNMFLIGQINVIEFNKLLYGDQSSVWNYKCGCATIKDLVALLSDLGLKIVRKRTNNFQMFVEGIRE